MAHTANTRESSWRALRRGTAWAAGLVLAATVLAVAGPLALGARPYTVVTGSMEPAIAAGDTIVAERIAPLDAGIGDVVMFHDPADQERTITHRVERMRRAGAHVWFVTRGDANDHGERWRVATDGQLGRVVYVLPAVGHVAMLARRIGPAALLALLVLLVADELWRIWRPSRPPAAARGGAAAEREGGHGAA